MYGGVSLAIYMYGVAVELLNLVKATAPAEPGSVGPGPLAFPDDANTTLHVYRKLARLLGAVDAESGPVRVRFVVDLISGTSAGGLNGVCLATVLANDRPGAEPSLDGLEELWVKHGGLETLLAGDAAMVDPLTGVPEKLLDLGEPPPSLLNGRRFYKLLADTLRDKLTAGAGSSGGSRLVDQLDLWVTATNLDGREVSLPIANAKISEREHAYRFHFRYDDALGHDDFSRDVAAFVAFAGRSSASFPVAFEPMRLERIQSFRTIEEDWQERFYSDVTEDDYKLMSLSDGGILDNKPFSYATQELVRRPATLPVDRYLVYVEPDVGDESSAGVAPREWNALETAIAALTGIPRSETIRDDLELVRRRNRAVRRARRLISETRFFSDNEQCAQIAPRIDTDDWRSMDVDAMVTAQPQFGPTYPAYHRLKVNAVCEYLARLVARSLDLDETGDAAPKLRAIVETWKRDRYQAKPTTTSENGFPRTETDFLYRYDMPFRIRRLAYVLTRLRELEADDARKVNRVFRIVRCDAKPIDDEESRLALRSIRAGLSEARNLLVQVEQRLPRQPEFRAALAESGVTRATIDAMGAEDEDALAVQVPGGVATRGYPFDDLVEKAVAEATTVARAAVENVLGERHSEEEVMTLLAPGAPDLDRLLRLHYDSFEAYDLVYLPLSYDTAVADTNEVEIVRISPSDAERPLGVDRELKGAGLNHFGAFLDSTWRQHDIAWGRLNAAEILIRNLAPPEHADALIDEAHGNIQEQYAETIGPVADGNSSPRSKTGQPLLADVAITSVPPKAELVKTAAGIAGASLEHQLHARGNTTPARIVGLVRNAAGGAGVSQLLRGIYSVLPTTGKIAVWVAAAAAPLLVLVLFLAGLGWLGFIFAGMFIGAIALVGVVVVVARKQIAKAIDKALERFGES